ncbi:hypothetical protein DSO57_1011412 [Entomophthora muscae]|uniref:Uncharacterized protein n=1 Tax=Entomophthora muscae TaxID=34485 RepID=A0ACC2UG43_9FUNG|nr:hypothetical protein DSO57_1011412 [Entomophthora muscae]
MTETEGPACPDKLYGSFTNWLSKVWQYSLHSDIGNDDSSDFRDEKMMPVITVHPSFPRERVYPSVSATNSLSGASAKVLLKNSLKCYRKKPVNARPHSTATIRSLFSQLSTSTPSLASPSPGSQTATAKFVQLSEAGKPAEPYIQLDPLWDDFYIVESSMPVTGDLIST